MLSIKIYHVCGKNPSLKKFNEGGETLAWVSYCEVRGSVGFLQGLPWAVSDRHEAAAFPARSTASDWERLEDCDWLEENQGHWLSLDVEIFLCFHLSHSDSTTSSKIPSLDVSSASQSSATPGQTGWNISSVSNALCSFRYSVLSCSSLQELCHNHIQNQLHRTSNSTHTFGFDQMFVILCLVL